MAALRGRMICAQLNLRTLGMAGLGGLGSCVVWIGGVISSQVLHPLRSRRDGRSKMRGDDVTKF